MERKEHKHLKSLGELKADKVNWFLEIKAIRPKKINASNTCFMYFNYPPIDLQLIFKNSSLKNQV